MGKEKFERRESPMAKALKVKEEIDKAQASGAGIVEINIDLVDEAPYHDRTTYSESAIHTLANNIKEIGGLINPVVLREKNGRYECIAGFRRIQAIKILEWSTVSSIVVNVSEEIAALMMLSENVLREDLNPYDEFMATMNLSARYLQMSEEDFKSFVYRIKNFRGGRVSALTEQEKEDIEKLNEVLKKIGKFTYDGILNRMRMLMLPDILKEHIKSLKISYLVALSLNKMKNEPSFLAVVEKAVSEKLSQREVDALYRDMKKAKDEKKKVARNPFLSFSLKDKEWGKLSEEQQEELSEMFHKMNKILSRE